MKSSSGYEIYHNTLSSCLDEIEDYVKSKGYQVGDYFPLVNHVHYGKTERTELEMLKDNKEVNTLKIQIYRMDSGRYELNCYPVRKFSGGGGIKSYYIVTFGFTGEDGEYEVHDSKPILAENEQEAGILLRDDFWAYEGIKPDIMTITKAYKTGGYTRPAYDLKTTGDYVFHTNRGVFLVTSLLFERQNDTEDALEIQDNLRGELGSIIIKNSAWKKLASGKSVKARSSKGGLFGTLRRAKGVIIPEHKFSGGGSTDEGIDLFEDYENIPPQVQAILDKYEDSFIDGDYKGLQQAHDELWEIGYTFEYYLDGVAYDLRPIGTKGKITDTEKFSGGGKILWAVKKGDPHWKEQIITEKEERIEDAKKWAIANGFDRFRISTIDLKEKPDFKKTFDTGGGVGQINVGEKYLYKFDNKIYEVLGVGQKQVALAPLPISSFWNNWIVSKPLMEKWVKNKMMIKQK